MIAVEAPTRSAAVHRGVALFVIVAALLIAIGFHAPVADAQSFSVVDAFEAHHAFALIIVPADWNGSLFVYAHGYATDASGIVPYPSDLTPGNLTQKLSGPDVLLEIPLRLGYAVATTTYRSGGWAMSEAVRDVEVVRRRFARRHGRPRFTYIWGHSEGGLVAETAIEQRHARYDGALPLCAPGAGARRLFNGEWDVRALYEGICRDLPGARLACGLCTDGEGRCLDDEDCIAGQRCDGMESLTAPADGLSRECLDFLVGPPGGTRPDQKYIAFVLRRATACFGGGTPTPEQEARKDLFVRATRLPASFIEPNLFFASVGLAEIVHRRARGLHPWGNIGVKVRSSDLSDAEATELDEQIPRGSSQRRATRYLRKFHEPTGHTRARVLTVHALDDGVVPVDHEEKYREAFHSAGRDSQLEQVFTTGGVHCFFSPAEHVAALVGLTNWVEQGTRPTAPALQASCEAVVPETAGPCRIVDFVPPEWGERVPERTQPGVSTSSLVCSDHPGDCPVGSTCGSDLRCE